MNSRISNHIFLGFALWNIIFIPLFNKMCPAYEDESIYLSIYLFDFCHATHLKLLNIIYQLIQLGSYIFRSISL